MRRIMTTRAILRSSSPFTSYPPPLSSRGGNGTIKEREQTHPAMGRGLGLMTGIRHQAWMAWGQTLDVVALCQEVPSLPSFRALARPLRR